MSSQDKNPTQKKSEFDYDSIYQDGRIVITDLSDDIPMINESICIAPDEDEESLHICEL